MTNKYKIQFLNPDKSDCRIFYTDKNNIEHYTAFKKICPLRLWDDITKWDEKDFVKANNLLKRLRRWNARKTKKIVHVLVDNKSTLFFTYTNISEIYSILKSCKSYKIISFDFKNKMEFDF